MLAAPSDDDAGMDDPPAAIAGAQAAAAAANDGGPPPAEEQIDLPEGGLLVLADRPAATPKFRQRSAELLAHARQVRAIKSAQAKAAAATAEAETAKQTVASVAAALPGANALLGGLVKRRRLTTVNAQPSNFATLALAAHIPCRQDLRVGVKRKRLVCAMAKFLRERQESSLAGVLQKARGLSDSSSGAAGDMWSVFTYAHQWDESRAFFAPHGRDVGKERTRTTNAAQHIQVMVQRGTCSFDLSDFSRSPASSYQYSEEWLAPNLAVEGTVALDIWPALVQCLPLCWRLGASVHTTAALAESFDVSVFLPMADRASSNLMLMRHIGKAWEDLPADVKSSIFVLMDTCQVHSHHRGKLQLTSLKRHLGRHYSIAQMYRLPHVQKGMIALIERMVNGRFERDVHTPPPPAAQTTSAFLDTLFHFDREHHRRSGKKVSALLADLRALLAMANGDPKGGILRHHCVATPGARPCCSSEAEAREKYATAMINVLLGKAERLPTESRWTDLLPAMKRTLLRRFLHDMNVHKLALSGGGDAAENIAMVDEVQAASDYYTKINGFRAKRSKEYLEEARNIWELAVLSQGLDAIDDLLFAMLGGAERTEAPAKVQVLVDRQASLIGQAQASLLNLLQGPVQCAGASPLRPIGGMR